MKSAKEIIDVLNEVLSGELVAINQYFLHAKMCQNWGFLALAARTRAESIDEMKHSEALIDRILFLEGLPNLQRLDTLHIGQTVPEQMKSDLALEYAAVERLTGGIALCRSRGDITSEMLLTGILAGEERHIDWLETQIRLIEQLGEAMYLSQQLQG